jgi:ribosomal protein S18 acetylase RimI-like enzyme
MGTCALMREPDGGYALAKMAVAESARGHGVGRALAEAAIAHARAMGLTRLELFTNSVLAPAVQLYRSLGFVDAPLAHSEYGRANMRMVLQLAPAASALAAGVDR